MKRALKRIHLSSVMLVASMFLLLPSCPLPGAEPSVRGYETGSENLIRLTRDLTRALDPAERKNLHAVPLLVGEMPLPYLQHRTYQTEKGPVTAVRLSSGFVELMNGFAHALAIDAGNAGYMKSYLDQLPLNSSSSPLRPVSATAWSMDTMNHQQSHFNQIAGTLIAVEMAHYYLGFGEKHRQKAGGDEAIALNRFLSHKEWRLAVLHGAQNSLRCGLGVDGIIRFYEAIDSIGVRPSWAEYFMPPTADLKKITKDLRKLESHFFAGSKFAF